MCSPPPPTDARVHYHGKLPLDWLQPQRCILLYRFQSLPAASLPLLLMDGCTCIDLVQQCDYIVAYIRACVLLLLGLTEWGQSGSLVFWKAFLVCPLSGVMQSAILR